MQKRGPGVQRVRRVVVDAQIDRAGKALREQVRRRDIDRDHARGHKIRRRKKLRHIRQIARRRLRIGKQVRRLAHAAHGHRQRGGDQALAHAALAADHGDDLPDVGQAVGRGAEVLGRGALPAALAAGGAVVRTIGHSFRSFFPM